MKETIFVIGGCRSGKSSYSLDLAQQVPGGRKTFIATCVPLDDEMKQRVQRHREERDEGWNTIETSVELSETIIENSSKTDVILIDCLTLWVSNLLMETEDQDKIFKDVKKLTSALKDAKCQVILVSNEVGTGIVPENRLARLYRDIAGHVNQKIAACSDRVIWMAAGIPVQIKGNK